MFEYELWTYDEFRKSISINWFNISCVYFYYFLTSVTSLTSIFNIYGYKYLRKYTLKLINNTHFNIFSHIIMCLSATIADYFS